MGEVKIECFDVTSENIDAYVTDGQFDEFNGQYLRGWMSPESPYHRYAKTQMLLAQSSEGVRGGILVSHNPRIQHPDPVAAFHSLWLSPDLAPDDAAHLSKQLLSSAEGLAAEWSCKLMVGPFSCNTWHNRYRTHYAATETSASVPTFPGEVIEPRSFAQLYEAAGYSVVQSYVSTICPTTKDPEAEQEILGQKFRISVLHEDQYMSIAPRAYPLLMDIFKRNYLYAPAEPDEFLAIQALSHGTKSSARVFLIEPEDNDDIAAFIFTTSYGPPDNEIQILKTAGTSPKYKGFRLVNRLCRYVSHESHKENISRLIYALMVDDGTSTKISSDQSGEEFRKYALFGKTL